MTLSKRIFDILVSAGLGLLLMPIFVGVVLWFLVIEGRPVFYVSDRMTTPKKSFRLVKFRTMKTVGSAQNTGVSGGDKNGRISAFGQILRRSRFDEIPQLWNIFRGDMSFVGPRPPLAQYVQQFPELYGQVLKSRPGITGLATLVFHTHEEQLLRACKTADETDEVYRRRCVPAKGRLDLIYQANRSFCFDLRLMLRTGGKLFSGLGLGGRRK